MKPSLSQFILDNVEPILVEWESVARTMIPPAETMSVEALRDHAEKILRAVAEDMETAQTEEQRYAKSRGLRPAAQGFDTSASAHGALRQKVGFDLVQLAGEFRAFRATVLRLWHEGGGALDSTAVEQVTRFNEGIDQALAESIRSYSGDVAKSRDMFLAVLGHDLRNPLGSVSGCLELVGNAALDTSRKERAIDIARRSVKTMEDMITDLLEYTRTRLGRGIEVDPKAGDVGALCAQAIDEISAAHPNRSVGLFIDGDLHAPFDAARMRQVLTNLLGNALQHGDPQAPVELRAIGDSAAVTVEVINQGVPIRPDMLQVIFDPLVQIPAIESEPHERPATSLGLGLYIARQIVIAHGGTVAVESSETGRTTFKVRLPKTGLH